MAPAVVRRYLNLALPRSACRPRSARFSQRGQFLLRPPDLWRPFTAMHTMRTAPPGFAWDARIRVLPGIDVTVRDGFHLGAGSMRATVLGIPILSVADTPEISEGALQRYLAEGAWCPTALLPSNGVAWTALDASSARAMIVAGKTRASLDFHFGRDGLIERVYTAARGRAVGKLFVPTAWQGRLWNYAERDGLLIPLSSEVEWLLPDAPLPYYRGDIVAATYEFPPL